MKNCKNCTYCAREGDDMICVNGESEYVSDYVDANHTCDSWDGSEEECE